MARDLRDANRTESSLVSARRAHQLCAFFVAALCSVFISLPAAGAITAYTFSTEERLSIGGLQINDDPDAVAAAIAADAAGQELPESELEILKQNADPLDFRSTRLRKEEIGKYSPGAPASDSFFNGANPYDPNGLIESLLDLIGLSQPTPDLPAFSLEGHLDAVHITKEDVSGRLFYVSVDEESEIVDKSVSAVGGLLESIAPGFAKQTAHPGDIFLIDTTTDTAVNVLDASALFDGNNQGDNLDKANLDAFYQGSAPADDLIVFSVDHVAGGVNVSTCEKKNLFGLPNGEPCDPLTAPKYTMDPITAGLLNRTYTASGITLDGNDLVQYSAALESPSKILFDLDAHDPQVGDPASPGAWKAADPGEVDITGVHLLEYNVDLQGDLNLCQVKTELQEATPAVTDPVTGAEITPATYVEVLVVDANPDNTVNADNCIILFSVDRPVKIANAEFTEKDVIQFNPVATGDKFSLYQDMRPAFDGDVGREQIYGLAVQLLSSDELLNIAGTAPFIPDTKSIYFTTTSEDQIATTESAGTSLDLSSRQLLGTDHNGTINNSLSRTHHFNFDAVHRLASDENKIVFSTQDPIVVSDGIASANETADLFLYSGGLVTPFTDLDGRALPAWPADLDAFTIDDKSKTIYFSIRLDDPSSSVTWSGELNGRAISPDQIIAWNGVGKAVEVFNFGDNFFVDPDEDIDALHWLDVDLYLFSVGGDGAELIVPDGTTGAGTASDGSGKSVLSLAPHDLVWVKMNGKKLEAATLVDAGEVTSVLPQKEMSHLLPGADPYSDSNTEGTPNIDAIWARQVADAGGLDHYEITHGEKDPSDDSIGIGVTCAPAEITVTAADKNHVVVTDASTVITLTADDGSGAPQGAWSLLSGNGTFVDEEPDVNNPTLAGCNAGTANDGIACYQYVPGENAGEDAGAATFGLLHVQEGTVDISVTDGTATELTGTSLEIHSDPSVAFGSSRIHFGERKNSSVTMGPTGYPADEQPITVRYIDVEISGKSSNVPPYGEFGASTTPPAPPFGANRNDLGGMYLRSLDTDGGGGCFALLNTQKIQMAFECDRPGGCVGSEVVTINGEAIQQHPTYTELPLVQFDAEGIAPFEFTYPDAGRIILHAMVELGDPGGSAASETLLAVSNPFVVRPFAFRFPRHDTGPADVNNLIQADAATSNVVSARNPGGTSEAGNDTKAFISSGSAFQLRLDAVAWGVGDDGSGDGRPDSIAALADNLLTPDYTSGVFAQTVGLGLDPTNYTPSGGTLGTLYTLSSPTDPATSKVETTAIEATSFGTGESAGDPGTAHLKNQAYDEVGSIRLLAEADAYACVAPAECTDSAYDIFGASPDIGRFYPHSVEVSTYKVEDGTCSSGSDFTYMDHRSITIGFSLLAKNRFQPSSVDTITENYDETRGYHSGYTGGVSLVAEDATTLQDLTGRIVLRAEPGVDQAIADLNWALGAGTYVDRSDHMFARAGDPDGPYLAQLGLEWTGGNDPVNLKPLEMMSADATKTSAKLGNDRLDVRFGRAYVAGAYGPETEDITVPVEAQYWDGTKFVKNTDDNCTVWSLNQYDLRGVDDDADPDQSSDPNPGEMTVAVDTGSTTGAPGSSAVEQGDAGFTFSAPGPGNTGSVYLKLDLMPTDALQQEPWLLYDWDGDGTHDDSPPEVRITFGRRKANDQVIYWQERVR